MNVLNSEEADQEQQQFHVLAVDDSHIDRKILERLLTLINSSYQVTCVDSGEKALEYLGLLEVNEYHDEGSSSTSSPSSSNSSHQQDQVSKVNLIMTDYSMPGITGYDLLKRLKDSCWKDIPVVVMSSENVPSRIDMCLEGGAEEFLLKPLKASDLRKIHSHLLNSLANHDNDGNSISNGENVINEDIILNVKEDNDKKNCCNSSNKRKVMLATSSAMSIDTRSRVQELPVS